MIEHVHRLRRNLVRHTIRAGRAILVFMGPVAEPIKRQISKEEWQRVAVKFTGAYFTTGLTVHEMAKDPTFYDQFVGPLVPATLVGIVDAIHHYNHGRDPGEAATNEAQILPPASTPPPAPEAAPATAPSPETPA